MAPVQRINHFTHPGHDLIMTNISTNGDGGAEYICGGCKTTGGEGIRFRCQQCDYNMHEYCGSCPYDLSSFMHPQHDLSLMIRNQGPRQNVRLCDLCDDSVDGLFYSCETCNFDLHPLCTQFPQHLRHALHPTHQLTLQTNSANGSCAVCRSACSSWRYRCEACSFDIHLECVLLDASNVGAASTSSSLPPPRPGAPSPPPPQFCNRVEPQPRLQVIRAQESTGKRLFKMVFRLVKNLTLGAMSHMLFGTGDFPFFN